MNNIDRRTTTGIIGPSFPPLPSLPPDFQDSVNNSSNESIKTNPIPEMDPKNHDVRDESSSTTAAASGTTTAVNSIVDTSRPVLASSIVTTSGATLVPTPLPLDDSYNNISAATTGSIVPLTLSTNRVGHDVMASDVNQNGGATKHGLPARSDRLPGPIAGLPIPSLLAALPQVSCLVSRSVAFVCGKIIILPVVVGGEKSRLYKTRSDISVFI